MALGANRYGKSGIRLVTVRRDGAQHTFTDLEIAVRLEGDFQAAHTHGDNSDVLPTDTMRGTCYALARDGIESLAGFGKRLTARFLEASHATQHAEVEIVSYPWERVAVDGAPHPHTFQPAAGGQRVTTVTQARDEPAAVAGGVRGLRIAKTTGSAFSGFPRDAYTTLPEARDRIMATTVVADWAYRDAHADHDRLLEAVPATFAARFATHDESESVQHTLYAMGAAVLDTHPELARIAFRMPNEHHVLVDLSPYGLDNPGEVFVVTDRPYGVIEATIERDA